MILPRHFDWPERLFISRSNFPIFPWHVFRVIHGWPLRRLHLGVEFFILKILSIPPDTIKLRAYCKHESQAVHPRYFPVGLH